MVNAIGRRVNLNAVVTNERKGTGVPFPLIGVVFELATHLFQVAVP